MRAERNVLSVKADGNGCGVGEGVPPARDPAFAEPVQRAVFGAEDGWREGAGGGLAADILVSGCPRSRERVFCRRAAAVQMST